MEPEQRKLGDRNPRAEAPDAVPPGAPVWITPELITHTQKVWEPFYKGAVSAEDAVTILLSVGRLFRVLQGG